MGKWKKNGMDRRRIDNIKKQKLKLIKRNYFSKINILWNYSYYLLLQILLIFHNYFILLMYNK